MSSRQEALQAAPRKMLYFCMHTSIFVTDIVFVLPLQRLVYHSLWLLDGCVSVGRSLQHMAFVEKLKEAVQHSSVIVKLKDASQRVEFFTKVKNVLLAVAQKLHISSINTSSVDLKAWCAAVAPLAVDSPSSIVTLLAPQDIAAKLPRLSKQQQENLENHEWCSLDDAKRASGYGLDLPSAVDVFGTRNGKPYRGLPISGHANTILCAFEPELPLPYVRQTVKSTDGSSICLDWLYAAEDRKKLHVTPEGKFAQPSSATAVILIFPGLASWSHTNYITRLASYCVSQNFHVCVFNARGLGDTPLDTPRTMSANYTADVHHVVHTYLRSEVLKRHFQADLPLFAVGLSLGGIILSKYIGEKGMAVRQRVQPAGVRPENSPAGLRSINTKPFVDEPCPIAAAITVNSPLDCVSANCTMMSLSRRLMYQPSMTSGLVRYIIKHMPLTSQLPNVQYDTTFGANPVKWFQTFRTVNQYDECITVPNHGFTSTDGYYREISAVKWIPMATIPVLCMFSNDDPVVGPLPLRFFSAILKPQDQLQQQQGNRDARNEKGAHVMVEILPYGGHLGYSRDPISTWLCKPNTAEVSIVDAFRNAHQFVTTAKKTTTTTRFASPPQPAKKRP